MEKQIKDLSGLKRTELEEALKNEMNLDIIKVIDTKSLQEAKELFNLNTKRSTENALIDAKFDFLKRNNMDYHNRNGKKVLCKMIDSRINGEIEKEIYEF